MTKIEIVIPITCRMKLAIFIFCLFLLVAGTTVLFSQFGVWRLIALHRQKKFIDRLPEFLSGTSLALSGQAANMEEKNSCAGMRLFIALLTSRLLV